MRPASPPLLTVVAGPNGAGKSTLTRLQLAATAVPVLDPDARARQLDAENPARAGIAASRYILTQSQLLIDTLTSFVLETTLSGHTALQTMHHARTAGFTVDLLYVCLTSVEGHQARVAARVAQGGHDVSEQDVRRRYARSLANLPRALALSDHALIFDNSSTDGYQLLLEWADGHVNFRAPTLPYWLQDHVGDVLGQMPESR